MSGIVSRRSSALLALMAFGVLAGCSGSDPLLAPGEAASRDEATTSDPLGDTFGSAPVPADLTEFALVRDATTLTARLEFSRHIVSPLTGDPEAPIAFLDLDVDQNPATGRRAVVDEYRLDGGATALGVEFGVDLSDFVPNGSVPVRDANGDEIGRVTPTYAGRTMTVRIPLALIGDDGYVNAAVIVGASSRPSDLAPNVGHLTLNAP